MEKIVEIVGWIVANYALVISAVMGILSGVIGICLLLPGDAPEKQLQAIVDFLSKFSAKPKIKE